MARLWPDSFVEEANLTQNVFQLRKVFGETQSGTNYIETVPRRGYRFVGEVKALVEEQGVEWMLANRTRTRIVHEEETDTERGASPAPSNVTALDLTPIAPAAIGPLPDASRRHKKSFFPGRSRLLIPAVVIGVLLMAGGLGLSPLLRPSRNQG